MSTSLPSEPTPKPIPVCAATSAATTEHATATHSPALPLAGLRVVEMTHMVMGPSCGMLLADLGAEVIKVEPPKGDNTRRLLGSGAGFYPLFNRNKKSVTINSQSPAGREALRKLIASADVFSHNFKSETMLAQGLDYASVKTLRADIIYLDMRGFLPGPYAHRTALDEVVQMMGGLAYMTGRPGDPLRAGSSVNDMMGGIFAASACLAALLQRKESGQGQCIQSALFENNILLVAQHIMQYQVTGLAAAPMPERISPWGIYDVFSVADGEQIFLSIVSDTQWAIFCDAFAYTDLRADSRIQNNNQRVQARPWLLPLLRERLGKHSASHIAHIFEANGLPYAPICKPHELLQDPHVQASGSLEKIILSDGERAGQEAQTVLFPFTMNGEHLHVRSNPPRIGEHNAEILGQLGYSEAELAPITQDANTRQTKN